VWSRSEIEKRAYSTERHRETKLLPKVVATKCCTVFVVMEKEAKLVMKQLLKTD